MSGPVRTLYPEPASVELGGLAQGHRVPGVRREVAEDGVDEEVLTTVLPELLSGLVSHHDMDPKGEGWRAPR